MKNIYVKAALVIVSGAMISCENDSKDDNTSAVTKEQVVENYANIVYQNYQDSYDDAVELETAINTFTATPTNANFTTVKTKWLEARESYGTTEAFRFAAGPIDEGDDAPEGLLNAWPLDENYIDYVDGGASDGIIADVANYPVIDKALLADLNESGGVKGGEKNISVGYHAIEFLLWGQDLTPVASNLPGQRPYTDYVLGAGGTGGNQERRALYLKVCADLLTDNLDYLVNQWKEGGAYRTTFLSLPTNQAIKNMYLGITTLVMSELPIERMQVALNLGQEDEHSCFSDNTHRDIILNLEGIINVYQGKYGDIDGASLEDLVRQANVGTVYADTQASMNLAVSKVAAIMTPFDIAISAGASSPEGVKISAAVAQLVNFGENMLAGATSIGIQVNG